MPLLLAVALSACGFGGIGFVHDERIAGPYRLVAVDDDDEMVICIDAGEDQCAERTPARTFGYGFNERYITAIVQDPSTHAIGYYYIDRHTDRDRLNGADSTIGPLTAAQFEADINRLGLPPITVRKAR